MRTAAAVLVLAVVLLLTVAAPTSAAGSVPSQGTWERLAQCESSGRWHLRDSRRYSGGLQFSDATWRSVGGSGRAADASKNEQIARATTLLRRSGWGQWPACSRRLRLR